MLSDRVQRQIDRLLDQAEEAIALRQWEELRATSETLLSLDPDNSDAALYLILANDSLTTIGTVRASELSARVSRWLEVESDSSEVAEPVFVPDDDSHREQEINRRHEELVVAVKVREILETAWNRARRTAAGCLAITVAIIAIIIGFSVVGALFWPVLLIVPVVVLLALWRRRRS